MFPLNRAGCLSGLCGIIFALEHVLSVVLSERICLQIDGVLMARA